MPGHDELFKRLFRAFFTDLLHLAVPEIAEDLRTDQKPRFLNTELMTTAPEGERRQVDLVARVRTRSGVPERVMVHVEIEAEARRSLDRRMLEYGVLLRARHGPPVLPIVVYVRGGPGPGVTWRTAREIVNGKAVMTVDYAALSLSRSSAEEYLERPQPLAWALAALMSTSLPPEEHRLGCMEPIADAELTDVQRLLLWNCVATYVTLKGEQTVKYEELIRSRDMTEVRELELAAPEQVERRGVLRGLEKGRLVGFEEGREEGRLEGERRLLHRLLETRFGPLSDDLRRRIETIGSADHLERLFDRALEAASLADLEPSD